MAETTIEWTRGPNGEKGFSFNPWVGCTKVGPGCDHCYAEGWAKRSGQVEWGAGAARRRTSEANWKQPLRWNAEAERLGIRYRVFCASLADVADNEVPVEWRRDLFEQIRITPYLDWLLVTKRIGNFLNLAEQVIRHIESMPDWSEDRPHPFEALRNWLADWILLKKPPANVWLGITVVNQAEADRDIPKLLSTPAAVRFLSMEPLLGTVQIAFWLDSLPAVVDQRPRLDWVIVGGESGPGARPMHPQWARDIRDQCEAAGVAFMFKQWGAWETCYQRSDGTPVFRQFDTHEQWVAKASSWVNGGICLDRSGKQLQRGADMAEARDAGNFPVTIMHKVGKKKAGRLLDGCEHNGFPEVRP